MGRRPPPTNPTGEPNSVRVDQWAWAVRLYPTRTAATAACRAGHVRIGGRIAKPAAEVVIGDRVEARTPGGDRTVEVSRLVSRRVGAPIAVDCYADHTPPAPPRDSKPARQAVRDPGAGRPTKRDRREIDRLRGR